jgi:hypothetical protein
LTGAAASITSLKAPAPVTVHNVAADDQLLPASVSLPGLAAVLATAPVFAQAPWVRVAPLQALLFIIPPLAVATLLHHRARGGWSALGALLVGFCGTWVGGCLFWGWFRVHPLLHLPIEGFALPLALAGLNSRWRLAAAFYLASLLGTALTDLVMALTGVMRLWPLVLSAPMAEAPGLLHGAALEVLQPIPLLVTAVAAAALLRVSAWMADRDQAWRVAAATLRTTLLVDGLFLMAAMAAPRLSGLI